MEGERLGSLWIRQQSSPDKERVKGIIKHAMACGQTCATVLRMREEDLTRVEDVEGTLVCPWWKVRDVISKERIELKHSYQVSNKFAGVIQTIEQEGLAWCVGVNIRGVDEASKQVFMDSVYALIVYWHPSTAQDNAQNQLYKYFLSHVIQCPLDEQRLKRYANTIKAAMDAGQTSCVLVCLGYQQSYWKREFHTSAVNTALVCKETRHYMTGAHIVLPSISPEWILDSKFEPLLTFIEKRHGLSWTLRFAPLDEAKFVIDATSQLHPWALLTVVW